MVGFKTFWILMFMSLFAACVPQTKQSQCKSNEAFNPAQRTCIPVVGGSTSLLNISNFSPLFTQSRSKDDVTLLTFSITVANPYNESYSVEWERVFNAAPISMCGNTTTCSFSAALLGTTYGEVGTHVLTAKVKDSNGAIADSHSFELKVSALPKPVINTATLNPSTYAFDKIPTDPRVQFSFTIKNNNATITAGDNYRTVWTLEKNGSTIYTETDAFSVYTTTGNNTAYFGTAGSPGTPYFNPATLGVGNYVIRAAVQNDNPGEVVEERQWNVNIKQPDLANVTGITLPAPGVTITAHNNVDYDDYTSPLLSWKFGSPATQPQFCVTVDDRDGTYATDGLSIQVRWYLDSTGSDICTKKTVDTAGSQMICLVDATPCEGSVDPNDVKAFLKFSNANASIAQNHKVTARLFDEATTQEFQRADVIPSNGSYPIEWLVTVNPVNTPPVIGFGTVQPTGCISGGSYTKTNCTVNQGSNFTVSFTTTDDFYSPVADAAEFQWNVNLKLNGTDLTSPPTNTACSKAFATATTVPAGSGPYTTQWTCTMAVPHFISTGPLNPSVGSYQVIATLQDSGSPVGGASLTANTLTWNMVVTETNPSGIVLAAQTTSAASSNVTTGVTVLDPTDTNSYATELGNVTFMLDVTDNEVDDFKYRISLCTDNTSSCTTSLVLSSPAYISFLRSIQTVPTTNPVLVPALVYQLPEDLLIGKHSTPIDVDLVTSRLVYYKVDVIDSPSVPLTTQVTSSRIFSHYVRNYNPAPTINSAAAIPAVGSTTVVYSGFPFTIDPGTVTDASVPAVERNITYQWYAKIGAGAWTAIPSATTRLLRYTPGNTASTIDLKLCVGDGTQANVISSTGTCSSTWAITPKPYLNNLTSTGSQSLANEVAVWYDEFNQSIATTQVIYSAYIDANNDIFVEKTVKDASGNIILTTRTITFEALSSGSSSIVSNISITGSADSVYVAYLASGTSSPSSFIPRVRRINKDFDLAAPARAKSLLADPAPFGFIYGNFALACSNATACNPAPAASNGIGGPAAITFADRLTTGDTISINGEIFTAAAAPTGTNQICDASACATINSMASNVRDKINNSTLASLHGIVASSSLGVVYLHSSSSSDFLDYDGSIVGVPSLIAKANGLGKIFVAGGRWHLPMINNSLTTDQENITVLSGASDVHLRSGAAGLVSSDTLTEMGKVLTFDAKVNTLGQLVFASISSDGFNAGKITLSRYALTGSDWAIFDVTGGIATDRNELDIMGAYSFESVKLAANAVGNPYYYVIAKEQTVAGAEWHIGRYDYQLDSAAASLEYFLTAQLNTLDATDDMITDIKIKSPEIVSVPGFSEARLFFHSVGLGATAFPRMARWMSDNTISCGSCFSLTGALAYQSTAKIGVSQVANNLTFGTAGAVTNENIKDTVFVLFSTDISASSTYKPQLGIINIEAEAIQSTSVDATGLFQPPFASDL